MQTLQLIFNYHIIRLLKKVKFFKVGILWTGFLFQQKSLSPIKNRVLKMLFPIVTSSLRHQSSSKTHRGVVINRAKFHACKSFSFGVVKTHTHRTNSAL